MISCYRCVCVLWGLREVELHWGEGMVKWDGLVVGPVSRGNEERVHVHLVTLAGLSASAAAACCARWACWACWGEIQGTEITSRTGAFLARPWASQACKPRGTQAQPKPARSLHLKVNPPPCTVSVGTGVISVVSSSDTLPPSLSHPSIPRSERSCSRQTRIVCSVAMSTKAALKSIRTKLQDSEPEGALYEATNLLKSLPEDSPDAPNVCVL